MSHFVQKNATSSHISQTSCDVRSNIPRHRNPLTHSADPSGSLTKAAWYFWAERDCFDFLLLRDTLDFPVISINTFRWHRQHAECYKPLAWHHNCVSMGSPLAVIYPKWEYINNTDTTTSQVSGIQTHFHCVRGSCIIIRFIDLWDLPAAILTSPKLEKKKIILSPLGTLVSLCLSPQNRCNTSLTHTNHPAR